MAGLGCHVFFRLKRFFYPSQIKELCTMTRAHKALAILVVSTLGLWGCAKGPGGSGQERIKALEAKVSRLEGDLKVGESAREQLRKKLAAAEERLAKLQHDRDDLEKTLTARTSERDNLQTQFEQFRKNLRDLLGQAEASAPRYLPPPVTATATGPAPGKS
jgi:septal ring factor EnvC (AmiA/AmiB activator)